MAGDIPITEHGAILYAPSLESVEDGLRFQGGRVLHRYGERVVVLQTPGPDPILAYGITSAPQALSLPETLMAELSEIELLGLLALDLRQSSEYVASKLQRPRQGEVWDMPRCVEPALDVGSTRRRASERAPLATSAFLEGRVAVGLVLVDGPTPDLQFSEDERIKVIAEVQNGLSFYANQNPSAGISFVYDWQSPRIDVTPDPNLSGQEPLEGLWRNPTMGALGYSQDRSGVLDYVADLRTRFSTRWTYCAFFTKYPVSWFAYAYLSGPHLVMQYANDGWGPDNIDRVFTHETGHIFGCPDEYAGHCDCDGAFGRFGEANANCQDCAPGGGVACLMKINDWAMCPWTPAHLGWPSLASGDDLQAGEGLYPGQAIVSADGGYSFVYQSDGNLVLYRNRDGVPLWNSKTAGTAAGDCVMQKDGALVVTDGDVRTVWSSRTADASSYFEIQNDGNGVVYRPDGTIAWCTECDRIRDELREQEQELQDLAEELAECGTPDCKRAVAQQMAAVRRQIQALRQRGSSLNCQL